MTTINTIGNMTGLYTTEGTHSGAGADALHLGIHDALKSALDALEADDTALTGATLVLTGNASVGGTLLSTGVFTTTVGAVIGTTLSSGGLATLDSLTVTNTTTLSGAFLCGAIEIDGALNHDGATAGFYGATPTAQLTGVAVSDAGIHAALVTLGLITA